MKRQTRRKTPKRRGSIEPRGKAGKVPKGSMRKEGTQRERLEHYKITMKYSKGRQETVDVLGRDSDDALNHALKIRKRKSLKPRTIIVKDGVGEFLGKMATGIGRLQAGVGQVRRGYHLGRMQALVKEAQSKDPTKRAIAKRELQQKYPELYKNLAFEQV